MVMSIYSLLNTTSVVDMGLLLLTSYNDDAMVVVVIIPSSSSILQTRREQNGPLGESVRGHS